MAKIQHKRESALEKAWYIVKPFLVYTVVKTIAILGMALLLPTIPIAGLNVWVENHSQLLSTTINGIAALIGVVVVLREFIKEMSTVGEMDIDSSVIQQLLTCVKNGIKNCKNKAFSLAAVISMGISAALALNIFIELLSVSSEKYENVEAIQYSVPLWLGLLLYGLVSPVTEEIIFRGITYNRMKRFFKVVPCVLVTSLLFGGFHANLPQFLYGTCMGVLMTLVYEWTKTFAAPLLLHMAANVFVFVLSFVDVEIASWTTGGVFAVIAAAMVVYLARKSRGK
ncbi:MAG: CPBP family intramembrane glutamic endopeptidase [Lachnospiraceae bacterium]|nr:CPBP family intramembrane glutamic endopeptidase [Lachnospiraceae bacterium]